MIKELDGAIARLEKLMADINLTNCQTEADGKTLTELIARKDALSVKLSSYRDIAYEANQNTRRARNTEIKIDNKLQETNWTTELIEK